MGIAGQYGKPRSKPTETVEGVGEVMSFKGENINGFDLKERKWNPERLLHGYFHSAATLNFLRAYTMSADPTALCNINLTALQPSAKFEAMKATAREIGAKYVSSAPVEFFTAHEAMQLDLEEALTRPVGDEYYNLSAHLLWIGDRTRQLDNAHVEYFKGISNPIGCKIGPSMKAEELQELVTLLNPNKEEGRLTLITRYGAGKVEDMLPTHIEAVKATGVAVRCCAWQRHRCQEQQDEDPTHGRHCCGDSAVHCSSQEMWKHSRRYPCGGDGAGDCHRVPRRKRRHHRGHAAPQLSDRLRPAPQLRAEHRDGLQSGGGVSRLIIVYSGYSDGSGQCSRA